MKILFAASEAAPFVKSGGLGDVMGALPRAISETNDATVSVILPLYPSIKHNPAFSLSYICHFYTPLSWRNQYTGLFRAASDNASLTYYFIDNEYYFGRGGYGYEDDGERFAFFSKAVLEALPHIGFFPDIIHLNDWQCGFLPLFLKAFYQKNARFARIRTVFTVHNIEYQGKADPPFLADVLGVDEYWRGAVTFDGLVNAMKTALVLSDRLTTVSRTYAHELCHAYFAHGLHEIIKENMYKMTGIVNGLDSSLYAPDNDPYLEVPYSHQTPEGKEPAKRKLCAALGLHYDENVPLFVMVSRLVPHKGLDLVRGVIQEICASDIRFAVLGTGYAEYENMFYTAASHHPGKIAASITFDEALSHLFYAGADFLLMPSKSEPCGLSQLIAMRYGTIPIVRETGGLVDTVPPISPASDTGYGLTFKTFNAHDMLDSIYRAISLFHDKSYFYTVRKRIMQVNTDWRCGAAEYMALYQSIL